MNRKQLALIMVLVSAGMGLLGMVFFYEQREGINVPIFMTLVTIVILLMAWLTRRGINRRNLWIIVPMLFFAVMVPVRASYLLVGMNLTAMVLLGVLYIRYLTSDKFIDTAPTSEYLFSPLDVGIYTIYAPMAETWDGLTFIKERGWKDLGNLGAVARGLLFAVPILLVFGVLLGSADAVFAEQFSGLFDWLKFEDPFALIDPLFIAGVVGWLMLTALSYAIARRNEHIPTESNLTDEATEETDDEPVKKQRPGFRIGMIEASMILGSVALLFGFFVVIQFAYLFGGQENIAEGLTYSNYARRGFFELVAVAMMVLGMILYLDHITLRKASGQNIIFRVLSIVIVGLTLVMLVSAWRRLELYELAYGFTYLRVLPHVFMVWLGILLGFAILHLFRVRQNIFALGLLLSCIGYCATLNIMNIDQYIAERNIQAYLNNENVDELDICYLRTLSVDAQPAMSMLFNNIPENDTQQIKDHLGWWFTTKQNEAQERMSKEGSMWSLHFAYAPFWFVRSLYSDPYAYNEDITYSCYARDWF